MEQHDLFKKVKKGKSDLLRKLEENSFGEGQTYLPSVTKPKRKKPVYHEQILQIKCCEWLTLQHPGLDWSSDLASGMNLPIHIAAKNKKMRSSRGLPDMMFYEPRGQYHGLVIELKSEHNNPFLKDGTISKNEHVQEQVAVLHRFGDKGFQAELVCGLDHFIHVVNTYFGK